MNNVGGYPGWAWIFIMCVSSSSTLPLLSSLSLSLSSPLSLPRLSSLSPSPSPLLPFPSSPLSFPRIENKLILCRSEGIITVVIAVIGFWLTHDFPDTAKFLTDEERVRVIGRLQADDQFSAAGEAFAWSNLTLALKDWKTWCGESRTDSDVLIAY